MKQPATQREVDPPGFRCLGWVWRCVQCDAIHAHARRGGGLSGGRHPATCNNCDQRDDGFSSATVYECERCGEWVCHNETNEHREGCEG